MKTLKRIAAFVLAISFCFILMLSPGANAQGLLGGRSFGALVGAGLVALNIVTNAVNPPQAGWVDKYFEWQWNPAYVNSVGDFFTYNYPEPSETVSEYLNRSTIKVNQGVTTIDGVEYDELWISPEGAGKVKADAFDFKTKWNILSNNVGTMVKGAGYVDQEPMYLVNNVIQSRKYTLNYDLQKPLPQIYSVMNPLTANFYYGQYGRTYCNIGGILTIDSYNDGYPAETWYTASSNGYSYIKAKAGANPERTANYGYHYTSQPFQFDYVSGIVPAQESDIPADYGLSLKIPHEQLETFYTTYPQYNVDNSVININEDQIDIDQLTQAIFDQIQSMEDIKAEWTNGEEPEPPAPVDPIENIDENVQSINEYQQNLNQQVNHMHEDVEAIHQTQLQQQQVQQQMQQTQNQMQQDTSSIDSTLKDMTATPGQSDLPSFKFDLRELFPFCIPFDIYRLLSSFDATPIAPHVRLPIVIQSIDFNYTLDLDFSSWDPVAQAMRTAELIVYAIGLAWATGKVIKW